MRLFPPLFGFYCCLMFFFFLCVSPFRIDHCFFFLWFFSRLWFDLIFFFCSFCFYLIWYSFVVCWVFFLRSYFCFDFLILCLEFSFTCYAVVIDCICVKEADCSISVHIESEFWERSVFFLKYTSFMRFFLGKMKIRF